jgi:hypothetical protein
MINYKKEFFKGLFLFLIIPLFLFFNFNILPQISHKTSCDNDLVRDYNRRSRIFMMGMACVEFGSPAAMLIMSGYYQKNKMFSVADSWLRLTAVKKKYPPAMLFLSRNCRNKSEAVFWYTEAVRIDPRIGSKKYRQTLIRTLEDNVRRMDEK